MPHQRFSVDDDLFVIKFVFSSDVTTLSSVNADMRMLYKLAICFVDTFLRI